MKKLLVAIILAHSTPFGCSKAQAAPPLQQVERQQTVDCKGVTTGTALEFFAIDISTNILPRRKQVAFRSWDTAYTTSTVRISTWAATTDIQGYPLIGFQEEYRRNIGPGVRLFVRRGTGSSDNQQVCGEQLE